MVDENRTEGAIRSFGGKVQDAVGGITGDTGTQAKGQANEAAGEAQNAFGSVLDTADEWLDSIVEKTKAKPLSALLVAVSVGYVIRMLTHTRHR